MYSENHARDLILFIKAIASNQIARFLPSLYVKLTNQTGRGSEETNPEETARYFLRCFHDYLSNMGVPLNECSSYLSNKRVLEYGPGDTLGVALLMYAHGAEFVKCVDRFHLSSNSKNSAPIFHALLGFLDGDAYERANSAFIEKGRPESGLRDDLVSYSVTDDGLSGAHDEYDLIISRAVLEHVNNLDRTIRDIKSALKKDGLSIHLVDLKSHGLDRYREFDFLTWPNSLYKLMYGHKGFPNRIRIDGYLRLIEQYELMVKSLIPTDKVSEESLKLLDGKLATSFRNVPLDKLSWNGFWIVIEHP